MLKTIACAVTVAFTASMATAAQSQTEIPPAPKAFVMAASQSDAYEILAATVAETQSREPAVLAFARDMIEAHQRLSVALRQAASADGIAPPDPGMSGDEAHMLSSLQSLRGRDFDKAYARQQVLSHTQALAVEESFGLAGAAPTLRAAALAATPLIRNHLKMADALVLAVGAR